MVNALFHMSNPCRDVLIAIVHLAGIKAKGTRRRVDQLKHPLGSTMTGHGACCFAVVTAFNLGDLECAFHPFFTQFFPNLCFDLVYDNLFFPWNKFV